MVWKDAKSIFQRRCHGRRRRRIVRSLSIRELKQTRRQRKASLGSEFVLFLNFITLVEFHRICFMVGTVSKFRKRTSSSSIKRVTRTFHVVFVQRRQRNVQKNMMHVLSCCFANLVCLLFCRSRCRRRRRCLSSLFKCTERNKTFFRVACRCLGHVHPVRFQSSV